MDIQTNAERIIGLHVNVDQSENVKNKIFQMYVDLVDCCEDEEEMTPLEAKAAAAIALLRIVSEAIPDSGRRAALLATNSSGEIIGRVSI